MNALFGIGCVAGIIYGIFVDGTFFKIYFALIAFYTVVFNFLLIDRKQLTTRKNINATSWGGERFKNINFRIAPTDPSAYLVVEYDVTKALPYIKKLNEIQSDQKITMTHLVTKALAVGTSKMRRDIGRIKWGYVSEVLI